MLRAKQSINALCRCLFCSLPLLVALLSLAGCAPSRESSLGSEAVSNAESHAPSAQVAASATQEVRVSSCAIGGFTRRSSDSSRPVEEVKDICATITNPAVVQSLFSACDPHSLDPDPGSWIGYLCNLAFLSDDGTVQRVVRVQRDGCLIVGLGHLGGGDIRLTNEVARGRSIKFQEALIPALERKCPEHIDECRAMLEGHLGKPDFEWLGGKSDQSNPNGGAGSVQAAGASLKNQESGVDGSE